MRRTLTTFCILVAMGVALAGCDQVALDKAQPSQSVSASEAFNQLTGFESALASTYDRLQSFTRYGQYYMLYPSAMADNANFLQGANRYNDVVANRQGVHLTAYGNPYDAINLANNIITKIKGFENIEAPDPQAVRDRIRGQALFLRALNYFDLIRTHAYEPGREVDGFTKGVILRTKPTESPDDADFRSRASNTEVYDQVVSDLQTATSLLEGKELPKSRANVAAAYGLLARVQLYLENWSAAETAATNAINKAGTVGASMMTPSDYPSAWFAETLPGSLFELKMTSGQDGAATNTNESLASLSYANACQGSQGYRTFNFQVVPTTDLIQSYPSGDVRMTLIDSLKACNQAVLVKYNQTLGSNADRIPVIRLAEMYLILAEARAEQNNLYGSNSAETALNTIRTNRGLSPIPSGLSQSAFIDSVLVERRRELVYEGHRFFDLKRRGRDIPKPQPNVTRSELEYTNFRILAPFPQQEVQSNPKLTQNPGY